MSTDTIITDAHTAAISADDAADAVVEDVAVVDEALVVDELLVEEISIDGMCGVY